MDNSISIIIPTYKRHDSLKKNLEVLCSQLLTNVEIVVVDQSPDRYIQSDTFSRLFPLITYRCFGTPSLPLARNEGIRTSTGSLIIFLDDDVVIDARCIDEHGEIHRRPDVHIVAGRIRQMNNASWSATDVVATVNMNTGETSGNFDLDYEGAVLYATGGHLSVKRPVFARTGLFNPFFAGNALYEDVDFSFRARKCGFTIWYNPRALVYHYPSTGGGCHAEKNSPYLTTRLHNHTLFYLLHIQIIPSKHYIIYMKNLIEFISRTPEIPGIRHSPLSVTWCLLAIGKAYFDWCRSYFPLKKSVR